MARAEGTARARQRSTGEEARAAHQHAGLDTDCLELRAVEVVRAARKLLEMRSSSRGHGRS